jgi:nucleoside-diphosphate-sugar epimerase
VRCLVVGGAGYLGGRVVDAALAAGYEVRVYDNLTYEDAYLRDVDFVFGDVRARTRLAQHLAWADSVVWLAGIVGDGACALDPLAATEINYDAVTWLVDHFDGRIIFTSTCSVYGAQDGLLTEDSPTEPLSLYALSKLAVEAYLSGRDALIFRLGTLYGLGGRVRLDLVLNTFTARAVTDRRLRVFGGGQWRPLLHVQDAADGIVTGLDDDYRGVVNLCSANVQILDLAQRIQDTIPGTQLEIVDMPYTDARSYRADAALARQVLGFAPSLTVEDGIREVKALVESGRIRDVNNPRWANQAHLSRSRHAT